jgi:endonuclease G, mitochondrial
MGNRRRSSRLRIALSFLAIAVLALYLRSHPPQVHRLPLPAGAGSASQGNCDGIFLEGKEPRLPGRLEGKDDRKLCFEGYAVRHSARSRTPLWSAEHLTRAHLEAARGLERENAFHEEARLPAGTGASLEDYARSGFDRGHMSPSADFWTPEGQRGSFSLANMVPQAPELNRGPWEEYESAVRALARRRGELYVVTGPLFEGAHLRRAGRVLVPSSVWKAVYDPGSGKAAALVCTNEDEPACAVEPLAEFEARTGLRVFPAAPPAPLQLDLRPLSRKRRHHAL